MAYNPADAPPGKIPVPINKKDYELPPNTILDKCPTANLRATCDTRTALQIVRYYYTDADETSLLILQPLCVQSGGTWTWTIPPTSVATMTPDTGTILVACDDADTVHTCVNYEAPQAGSAALPQMLGPEYLKQITASQTQVCQQKPHGTVVPRCSTDGVKGRCEARSPIYNMVTYYYTTDAAIVQIGRGACERLNGIWTQP
jgi:hypothetical protein